MALDAQSNWNVEMSQPLRVDATKPITQDITAETPSISASIPLRLPSSSREILLPSEIISNILSFIPRRSSTQSTFWACTLTSRAWYSASIALLYERPYLDGGNFDKFVATVCPSKNAHIRKSSLATLVHRLDMGDLVHSSSRSLTARLLGRLKGNMTAFVAPQTSFAVNGLAALSKCTQLRHLDLSLISASIPNKLLFLTLNRLEILETLYFPRSSTVGGQVRVEEAYSWPPRLKVLHLAGGIDDDFLSTQLLNVPKSLETLSFQHCSQVHPAPLLQSLQNLSSQLIDLTIRHPMSKCRFGDLNMIFKFCESLQTLRISAEFLTTSWFQHMRPAQPLRRLELDYSGTGIDYAEIRPLYIYNAVVHGELPDLRSVRVSHRLGWNESEISRAHVDDLADILEENNQKRPLGIPVGIWMTTS